MALIGVPAGRGGVADGIEYVGELLECFNRPVDPVLLRSLASSLEAKATTSYELGVARGLRILAGEEADARADADEREETRWTA
jgi:hypothetical protein